LVSSAVYVNGDEGFGARRGGGRKVAGSFLGGMGLGNLVILIYLLVVVNKIPIMRFLTYQPQAPTLHSTLMTDPNLANVHIGEICEFLDFPQTMKSHNLDRYYLVLHTHLHCLRT
jgi:hypothetical protein